MHALNGNVRRENLFSERSGGHRQFSVRELKEPMLVSKLRAAGWALPPELPQDYSLRVYDLRLELEWLRRLLPELGLAAGTPYLIGGDFLQSPYKEDAVALQSGRLLRWGPDGSDQYHLVVPPRPHMSVWLQRARQQLPLESPGTWISVCCVVPRVSCPQSWGGAALSQLIPQAEGILADMTLEVRVMAVSERPPLVRVPAETRALPPAKWEPALLARDRVLVVISFRRHLGSRPPVAVRWLGEPPPPVASGDLELLRLDLQLPPATKALTGERLLRAAVRKVTAQLGFGDLAALQLRQVQVVNGAASALLSVPRAVARSWLRGSGCAGLYIRPFWTPSTGSAVARGNFSLLWLKGRSEMGHKLWEALRDIAGFYGLLVDGRDLAVRVSAEVDKLQVQSQVQFILGETARMRSAEPGLRWWRLGPLAEAELWHVKDLIAQTGLTLAREDIRLARMGPFRSAVFFGAHGEPTQLSLDDGSWGSSEAQLTPAEPPPRRKHNGGPALSPQSSWGGPRQTGTSVQQPSSPQSRNAALASDTAAVSPTPASLQTPSVWNVGQQSLPIPALSSFVSTARGGGFNSMGTLPVAPAAQQQFTSLQNTSSGNIDTSTAQFPSLEVAPVNTGRRKHGRGQASGASHPASSAPSATSPLESQLATVTSQLVRVTAQMSQLLQEVQALRKENSELRRQVESARGLQQHQPYVIPSLTPLPTPVFSPVRPVLPVRTRIAGALTPEHGVTVDDVDRGADVVMRSPPVDVEAKRVRRTLEMPAADSPMVPADPMQPSVGQLAAPQSYDE